jgi:hypothetical protein
MCGGRETAIGCNVTLPNHAKLKSKTNYEYTDKRKTLQTRPLRRNPLRYGRREKHPGRNATMASSIQAKQGIKKSEIALAERKLAIREASLRTPILAGQENQ